jgi:hypothetical protein
MLIEAPHLCILGQIKIMEHGPSPPFIHIPTYMGEKEKGFTTLPMKSNPRIFSFFFHGRKPFWEEKKKIFEKNIGIPDL